MLNEVLPVSASPTMTTFISRGSEALELGRSAGVPAGKPERDILECTPRSPCTRRSKALDFPLRTQITLLFRAKVEDTEHYCLVQRAYLFQRIRGGRMLEDRNTLSSVLGNIQGKRGEAKRAPDLL